MKRYYNNVNIGSGILGERTLRVSHDGLVNEVLLISGIKYTYESDDSKDSSSFVDMSVLPTNKCNSTLIKYKNNAVPLIVRVVGLYKRFNKIKKNRNKRQIVIKGRLVAVGTTFGVIFRKSLYRHKNKKLMSRHNRKLIISREIGKLYRVNFVKRKKNLIVYKPIVN